MISLYFGMIVLVLQFEGLP